MEHPHSERIVTDGETERLFLRNIDGVFPAALRGWRAVDVQYLEKHPVQVKGMIHFSGIFHGPNFGCTLLHHHGRVERPGLVVDQKLWLDQTFDFAEHKSALGYARDREWIHRGAAADQLGVWCGLA